MRHPKSEAPFCKSLQRIPHYGLAGYKPLVLRGIILARFFYLFFFSRDYLLEEITHGSSLYRTTKRLSR